jgi:hypothetical protein
VIAGPDFEPGEAQVVDRVRGTPTTEFGAPDARSRWDDEPLDPAEANRLTGLLASCWHYFDGVVVGAPERLRKGPRGGGRDRDAIVDHVREAERSYARRIGVRLPPRTPWPDQRAALLPALCAAAPNDAWSARYALRRVAWHVLDHAWEIEDKSE